jgi:hypothetical protein
VLCPRYFINFERVNVRVRVGGKTVISRQWKIVVPKKRKTYHFHDEWEIKYYLVMVKGKCCLICNVSVSFPKKNGNL